MSNPYELHLGDNVEVMAGFEDNSIHSIVTDGPYGIGFMGKAWDNMDIQKRFDDRNAKAHNEVVRPGRKTNGFGKSIHAGLYNLSLLSNQEFELWTERWAMAAYDRLRPGGYLISFCSTRTFHRMVSGIENAGFEIRDTISWVFASGFPKSSNQSGEWEGWGTALKPAHELICIARKPLEGTVPQNLAKWGVGAINIQACRIDGEPWRYGNQPKLNGARYQPGQITPLERHAENIVGGEDGRWPANLIHDGSPEVLKMFPESDGQQGDLKNHSGVRESPNGIFGKMDAAKDHKARNDSGSAARFFKVCRWDADDVEDIDRIIYCAKTSRTDRNEGLKEFDKKPLNWSSGTQNPGSFQSEGTDKSSQNFHPTVKPTELMRYLVKMVTPKGGICLDPFMGSGSTGKACMLEDVKFIGIDITPEYLPIAEGRIKYALKKTKVIGNQMSF